MDSLVWLLFTLVAVLVGAQSSLYDTLDSLVFVNEGKTYDTDEWIYLYPSTSFTNLIYLEPENITDLIGMCGVNAWAVSTAYRYPYVYNSSLIMKDEQITVSLPQEKARTLQALEASQHMSSMRSPSPDVHPLSPNKPEETPLKTGYWRSLGQCTPLSQDAGYDRPGGDLYDFVVTNTSNPVEACLAGCCAQPGCTGYVYAIAPGDFQNCKNGQPCCYLKDFNNPKEASSIPGIVTGTVNNTNDSLQAPPSGIRSAVPLGEHDKKFI